MKPFIGLVSGLGESDTGYGQGMRDLAAKLRETYTLVARYTYKTGEWVERDALRMTQPGGPVFLIGHSYGGDAIVSLLPYLQYQRRVHAILIDPVRRGAGQITADSYNIPQAVVTARCYHRRFVIGIPRSSRIVIPPPDTDDPAGASTARFVNIPVTKWWDAHNAVMRDKWVQGDIVAHIARELKLLDEQLAIRAADEKNQTALPPPADATL